MTAALKDLTRKDAHHLVVNLIFSCRTCKRREKTCVGNRRIREKQMEVLEMAERESRNWFVFGKIRESEMCVSDCIQKINVSGQAFCSWYHETMRYGPVNQHFVWLFFCFKFTSYYFDICQFRRGNEDYRGNENRKSWKKNFFRGKKIDKHTFFPMKIKMVDLWMQTEVRKLIFIMNFSVLDFFKFASRMPQTAQIFVSTFKIFRGSMPPDPLHIFFFFFVFVLFLAILRIWVLKFLFFSTLTQSDFLLVVLIGWKVCCICTRIYFAAVPEYI